MVPLLIVILRLLKSGIKDLLKLPAPMQQRKVSLHFWKKENPNSKNDVNGDLS